MPANTKSPASKAEQPATDAIGGGRPIISADHERALRAELERLRHTLDVEFAERLREARGSGSGGDNDDYLQVREEEEVLAAAIARISMLLETAVVLEEDELEPGTVSMGSTVKVKDMKTGKRDAYRLIGGHEPLTPGVASAGSPIGRALMGRRAGDEIEVVLPNGRVRHLKIVAVEEPGDIKEALAVPSKK